MNAKKWLSTPEGFIDCVGGEPVCEYAGCGSHEAKWGKQSDYMLALAAPQLLALLKAVVESGGVFVSEYAGDTVQKAATELDQRIIEGIAMAEGKS